MPSYAHLMPELVEAVKQVGGYLREQVEQPGRWEVHTKSNNSFVTDMDVAAEQWLVTVLQKLLPDAGFITEEKTVAQGKQGLAWVIDPIDGTTNYMYGLPCYSISVALVKDGRSLLGVVYEVAHDECFTAVCGEGAELNGNPIHVNRAETLKDSLIATGFPYHAEDSVDSIMAVLRELVLNTRGIRRFGSAAVDLAYVACGRFDAFYEHTLNIWDIAAGALLVQEARGIVTDFSGEADYFTNGEVVAADAVVHGQLLEVVKRSFKS